MTLSFRSRGRFRLRMCSHLFYEFVYYVHWFKVAHDQMSGFDLVVLVAGFEGFYWLHMLKIPTISLQICKSSHSHRSTIIFWFALIRPLPCSQPDARYLVLLCPQSSSSFAETAMSQQTEEFVSTVSSVNWNQDFRKC
jgi:hypothetical protein